MLTVNIEVQTVKKLKISQKKRPCDKSTLMMEYITSALECMTDSDPHIAEYPFVVLPSQAWMALPDTIYLVPKKEDFHIPAIEDPKASEHHISSTLYSIKISFDPKCFVNPTNIDMLITPDYY
jgi:hypothetical protein